MTSLFKLLLLIFVPLFTIYFYLIRRNPSNDTRVSKITLWSIDVPLKSAFFPSWIPGYAQTHNRFTLIEVQTYSGLRGYASGTAFSNERIGVGSLVGPYLIGKDALDIFSVHELLEQASVLGWRNFWIENAFYDIASQHAGVPLWKYLGGRNDSIPLYLSTGEVCSPKHHSKVIKKAKGEGFKGVKIRVKFDTLEEDVNCIESIRKKLGSNQYPLMVDANQGWRISIADPKTPIWSLERAMNFSKAMEEYNIQWIEEPLERHSYEEYAKLRKNSKIRIAGGELNYGWNEIRMFHHFESLDIYNPDVCFSGIYDALKINKMIDKTNNEKNEKNLLIYSPHTWTNGIGLLLNLHIASLSDNRLQHPLEYPYVENSWIPEKREGIFKDNSIITPSNGYLQLPKEIGAGIKERLSIWKIRKYGKVIFTMTQGDLYKKLFREKGTREYIAFNDGVRWSNIGGIVMALSAILYGVLLPFLNRYFTSKLLWIITQICLGSCVFWGALISDVVDEETGKYLILISFFLFGLCQTSMATIPWAVVNVISRDSKYLLKKISFIQAIFYTTIMIPEILVSLTSGPSLELLRGMGFNDLKGLFIISGAVSWSSIIFLIITKFPKGMKESKKIGLCCCFKICNCSFRFLYSKIRKDY